MTPAENWQADGDAVSNHHHGEHSQQGSRAEHDRRAKARTALRPPASITDETVKPSGILCRKIARKTIQPSQLETMKAGGDGDAIKKRVDGQAEQHGRALVMINKLVMMRFLAKVKVPGHYVLAEVNNQVAEQHQEAARPPLPPSIVTLAGTISVIEVASIKPAPRAIKYFR